MVNSYYFKNFNTIQSVGHPAKYRTIELCNFQRKPTLLFFSFVKSCLQGTRGNREDSRDYFVVVVVSNIAE